MEAAAKFFTKLWEANIPAIALENPKMHPEAREAICGLKPSQTIHPHMHACEVGMGPIPSRICRFFLQERVLLMSKRVQACACACFRPFLPPEMEGHGGTW